MCVVVSRQNMQVGDGSSRFWRWKNFLKDSRTRALRAEEPCGSTFRRAPEPADLLEGLGNSSALMLGLGLDAWPRCLVLTWTSLMPPTRWSSLRSGGCVQGLGF